MVARLSKYAAYLFPALLLLGTLGALPASAQQFLIFDPPGSTQTVPQTINDLGQIVGCYYDSAGVIHGFEFNAGAYTTIDFPGEPASCAYSINDIGQITGYYIDSANVSHIYLLSGGIFTTIDDPAFVQNLGAGIDDLGNVSGTGTTVSR
jgi:uncharacterized membrane protein